jgi:putative transposase
LVVIPQLNTVCAVDFVSDTLYGKRWFRTWNILDEGVREGGDRSGYIVAGGTGDPSAEQVAAWRDQPQEIQFDKGPNLMADCFTTWCATGAIELLYIQPGSLNTFSERVQSHLSDRGPQCLSLRAVRAGP